VGIGLGILGTVVGILGYQEAVRSRERSARVEAYVYLDTAWDLMGGQPGGAIVVGPVSNRIKFEEARRAIERALILEPNSSRAFRIKGAYLRALGKLKEAIRSLETSTALDPGDYRSHAALGVLYMETEHYLKANVELSEARRLEPSDFNVLANLGILMTRQRKFADAISYYDQVIKLAPKYEAAFNLKGTALRNIGKNREALMCFAHAAEIRNNFALADELIRLSRAGTHNPTPAPDC
jgi:tetratricopeptide (TPR) repeat protein